ncbi:hypothetical protein BpHYR1_042675 [Brachionus plicatilis]|uniref:Uncharacterized protein n=1 Tax=Brachionus plicatilis TaxID=10195 RepID=A0A3M7PCM8_BRAPC|nr:hypothetical protein BpHYR1_042675 [Brachionus plicatilis]
MIKNLKVQKAYFLKTQKLLNNRFKMKPVV